LDVTYNIYRSTTSPVPIDAGHLVTSGITETDYTDCGNVNNRYYAVTAVNENGESDPSNEDRASESCGSAMALTLPETGGDPVVTKYYFHAGKRVAMDRDGVVQWLVGDHLGTMSLVLNANGTVHSEARHYPYGEERWSSGTLPTDYRFTGQRSESGLRLIHMGARFYDSALGRWISADTLVPDPGSPQSLNRYSYVYNSPLGFIDSSGHLPWWVNYLLWQAAMTYGSGGFRGTIFSNPNPPLLHGRHDVQVHTEAIKQSAPRHLQLIVAASIAHQASDPKDRPFGTDLIDVGKSRGIAQLRPGEIEEWAPDLAGQSRLDPQTAIRVMTAKIEAADQYILEQAEGYGGISQTDRFMLLALAQNCGTRETMQTRVATFFDAEMNWSKMPQDGNWKLQLRLVVLHIDWLLLQGWVLPEGVDLDYWRRTAFSDEESAE